MSIVRVHNFSISLDGFGTGEPQSHEAPFGHAGERLHGWMFTTRYWHEMVGEPGGTRGLDDAFARLHDRGMRRHHGCREVRLPRMARGPGVEGLVGSQPAVPHTGIRPHPSHASADRDGGGTTFHFLDVAPEAVETAGGRRRTGPAYPWRGATSSATSSLRASWTHAHRRRPYPPRPRRSGLGRTGGRRAGLRRRVHLLAQRGQRVTFTRAGV